MTITMKYVGIPSCERVNWKLSTRGIEVIENCENSQITNFVDFITIIVMHKESECLKNNFYMSSATV